MAAPVIVPRPRNTNGSMPRIVWVGLKTGNEIINDSAVTNAIKAGIPAILERVTRRLRSLKYWSQFNCCACGWSFMKFLGGKLVAFLLHVWYTICNWRCYFETLISYEKRLGELAIVVVVWMEKFFWYLKYLSSLFSIFLFLYIFITKVIIIAQRISTCVSDIYILILLCL